MNISRRTFLPHRIATTAAVTLFTVVTIGAGMARAASSDPASSGRYDTTVRVSREGDLFVFDVKSIDRRDQSVAHTAHLKSRTGEWATAQSRRVEADGEHQIVVRALGHADGSSEIEVTEDSAAPRRWIVKPKAAQQKKSGGNNGITVNVAQADVRDLLRTFASLANLKLVMDDDVSGTVSESLEDMPWTEALDKVMADAHLRYERTNDTIRVHR